MCVIITTGNVEYSLSDKGLSGAHCERRSCEASCEKTYQLIPFVGRASDAVAKSRLAATLFSAVSRN